MTDRYAQRTIVRDGFTEQDTWRKALGDAAPLLAFASYGPLDAPDIMPAGSVCFGLGGPQLRDAFRD